MKTVHDIFVRAYAIAMVGKKERKRTPRANQEAQKWPEDALVFDTETRITADQSLTFGVYRLCELAKDRYRVAQEGIFYADDLPAKDRKVLESYQRTAISDVPSFPPEFPLYSRSEFMRRVLWPAIKRDGALVCGLNLPFDLSRLAQAWGKGDKNEWSLTMSQYANGAKPDEWRTQGKARFLDLRTLGWALFNRSFSLKALCKQLETEHQTLDHEPTGQITPEEIEYARQDGRCTVDALNRLKEEFDKHPISLRPDNAYSPASVAKSYLEAMGISKPAEKFEISEERARHRNAELLWRALRNAHSLC